MKRYEVVREIANSCARNQMRDVFIEEITCDDPETYVRRRLKGNLQELTLDPHPDGTLTIHTVTDGLMEKFVFTKIE